MESQQTSASVQNLAKYLQEISSGVTNLLGELGRMNAAPSFDSGVIEAQLQTLIALAQGMDTRIAAVEQGLQMLGSGNAPGLNVISPTYVAGTPGPYYIPELTADEYNSRARRYNKTLVSGNDALMPIRTTSNKVPVGFPPTLGHFVWIDTEVYYQLLKAYGLPKTLKSLWTFIGVTWASYNLLEIYCTPHRLAEVRMDVRANREREIAAAGPVTASTQKAAAAHNLIARAHNAASEEELLPIHDARNIPVHECPTTLFALVNPFRQWDVLYLLEEYGQSVKEKKGCLARLIKFFGVDEKVLLAEGHEGEGKYGDYWYM